MTERRTISGHYDVEADAMQIALRQVTRVDHTIEVVEDRVNLDVKDDEVVGIELLCPRLPLRLAWIAAEHGFASLLDDIYSLAGSLLGCQVSGGMKLTYVKSAVNVLECWVEGGGEWH